MTHCFLATLRCITKPALILSCALALGACVTDDIRLPNIDTTSITGTLFGPDKSKRYPIKSEKLPFHVKAALAATVMRLRGQAPETVAGELGVRGSERVAPEAGFDFAGFAVRDIEILEYAAPEDPPLAHRIVGNLHFADGYRRHASVHYNIAYRIVAPSPLEITWAQVAPAASPASKATMFVVPAAAAEQAVATAKTYGDLYRSVVTSAVPLNGKAVPADTRDYAMVVLFEDRLPPGDTVRVGVSVARDGVGSFTGATRYLGFAGGWVVAIVPGRFAFGADNPFWIKAVHTPGGDGAGEPVVVGLFSSDPAAALTN